MKEKENELVCDLNGYCTTALCQLERITADARQKVATSSCSLLQRRKYTQLEIQEGVEVEEEIREREKKTHVHRSGVLARRGV